MRSFVVKIVVVTLLFILSSCLGEARPYLDGESSVFNTNEGINCDDFDCLGDLAPIIDTTELPDFENEDDVVSPSLNDEDSEGTVTDESDNISEEDVVCDDTIDSDGDGISCLCDSNDSNARIYAVLPECDDDGDGIPNEYDLCPYKKSENVIVEYLCDDPIEDSTGMLISDVDYDSDRWSCSRRIDISRFVSKSPFDKNVIVIDPAVITTLVDFPVAYHFPDNNNDGKVDGCPKISREPGVLLDQLQSMSFSPVYPPIATHF